MAELKVEVKVLDMPEVKAILAHYKKISRRHAWVNGQRTGNCLLYTSPSPRDYAASRMPSSA